VSDFGLSRELGIGGEEYYSGPLGVLPVRWSAPEALKASHFSSASDVWSFGILCGEIFDDGATVRWKEENAIVLCQISI
jgi:hypothetical protein